MALWIERAEELAPLVARAARADAIAVDVEANGLFAYQPRLCTVQLAFAEDGAVVVALVDALRAGAAPLAPLLGPEGPAKVLHDLTFDARMLNEAGAPLGAGPRGAVRDTSVAARLLGRTATGLQALLASELGVHVTKDLQQHDWARRPVTDRQRAYLADDVAHLLALDARLGALAAEADIAEEIADECAYRLATALRPPRDQRPAYARIKGAAALDAPGRAALRRLVQAREEAAATADVPPFKIVGSDVLIELSRTRPKTLDALRAVRGATAGRAAPLAATWLRAVEAAERDGDIPEEERALFEAAQPDRRALARRRAVETRVSAWRRAEAKARRVDEQVVLPGHCAHDLVDLALTAAARGEAAARDYVAAIPGLGARRLARYGAPLAAIVARAANEAASAAGEAAVAPARDDLAGRAAHSSSG